MKYSITAYDKAENELKRRREAVMNEHEVHAQEIAQRLPEIEVLTRSLKANNCEQTGNELSGGNQQKVLLGKWVRDDAKILMFDEPTHGVDIHAKQEIYSIIRNAAKNGAGVIVVSSELDELIELSDRIIMINNGQIVGEKTQKPFNDQEILSAIS